MLFLMKIPKKHSIKSRDLLPQFIRDLRFTQMIPVHAAVERSIKSVAVRTHKDMKSRVNVAVALFESGYNCAQSVFAAYADLLGMDRETALKISCPMGAGVG